MHKKNQLRVIPQNWVRVFSALLFVALCSTFVSTKVYAQVNIWAETGEDKVSQDELRMTQNRPGVINSVWDGTTLNLFGAKDEVINAAIVIEAPTTSVAGLSVTFNALTGPGGAVIGSRPVTGDDIFNWTGRNIELFYLRYLQIIGLSLTGFDHYDERQIPVRFQRPYTGEGFGTGLWTDRPDHDKFYPDIAVPLELVPTFTVAAAQNQSIWIDIYIPKTAAPGVYSGTILVKQQQSTLRSIPVKLTVRNFTLPDVPASKTMLAYTPENLNLRFDGVSYVNPRDPTAGPRSILIRNRYFQMAHRHKISLVDSNYDWTTDQPSPLEWLNRLDGSLFTAASGYDGPGVGEGNDIFSIGLYGNWSWMNGTEADMWTHTDAWESWFEQNSPNTERSLYLTDESHDYPQVESWASWIKEDPGPGSNLKSYATIDLPTAAAQIPSLSIDGATLYVADPTVWQPAANYFLQPSRELYLYNGHRPASGSFTIEDEGSSTREIAWGQYKMNISRWYEWESSYYNNYIGSADKTNGTGNVNVFETAHTFGGVPVPDPVFGETGWNYANGDGVLFYPGTDELFPQDSYGVDGPFASIRLKFWRRGVQDVDYITLAAAIDPVQTHAIVDAMVPKALWEYGIADPTDPTWQRTPISWSINPDDWEAARAQLAQIIESKNSSAVPTVAATATSVQVASATVAPTAQAQSNVATAPVVIPTAVAKTAVVLPGTVSGQMILRSRSARTSVAMLTKKSFSIGEYRRDQRTKSKIYRPLQSRTSLFDSCAEVGASFA